MPIILPCSISWCEQACFFQSDQQWTVSQINDRKEWSRWSENQCCQVRGKFLQNSLMPAMRPAREQILCLYLCSRHLPLVHAFALRESTKFNIHYFLAASSIRKKKEKKPFLKAICSCRPEKLRHACYFQVISTTSFLSVVLQSPDTEHTFMGTSWRILPAIWTCFIVLCFVILYVVKVQTDYYIRCTKPCHLPQQYRSACPLPRAQRSSLCLLKQRGAFRKNLFHEVWRLNSHISDSRLRGRGSRGTVAWLCSVSEMLSVWVPSGPTLPPFPSSVSSLFSSAISFS